MATDKPLLFCDGFPKINLLYTKKQEHIVNAEPMVSSFQKWS